MMYRGIGFQPVELRIIHYIEDNPVKAGLVERPEEWQWSSARIRANAGLQPGDAIRKCHASFLEAYPTPN